MPGCAPATAYFHTSSGPAGNTILDTVPGAVSTPSAVPPDVTATPTLASGAGYPWSARLRFAVWDVALLMTVEAPSCPTGSVRSNTVAPAGSVMWMLYKPAGSAAFAV